MRRIYRGCWVLNKIDNLDGALPEVGHIDNYVETMAISARHGQGLEDLLSAIRDAIERQRMRLDVVIPYQAGSVYSELNDKQYIETERTSGSWLGAEPATAASRG